MGQAYSYFCKYAWQQLSRTSDDDWFETFWVIGGFLASVVHSCRDPESVRNPSTNLPLWRGKAPYRFRQIICLLESESRIASANPVCWRRQAFGSPDGHQTSFKRGLCFVIRGLNPDVQKKVVKFYLNWVGGKPRGPNINRVNLPELLFKFWPHRHLIQSSSHLLFNPYT